MLVRHQTYHFWYLCLSPLFIILLGFLTATYFNKLIGGWAWIPLAIVYWSTLSFLIGTFKKEKKLKDWLQKSQRSPVWTTLSLIIGIIPLTILLQNYSLFQSIWIIFSWLLFALINPWLEEYYWRGILLEGLMTKVPQWVAIVYTTIFLYLVIRSCGVFFLMRIDRFIYIFTCS